MCCKVFFTCFCQVFIDIFVFHGANIYSYGFITNILQKRYWKYVKTQIENKTNILRKVDAKD